MYYKIKKLWTELDSVTIIDDNPDQVQASNNLLINSELKYYN